MIPASLVVVRVLHDCAVDDSNFPSFTQLPVVRPETTQEICASLTVIIEMSTREQSWQHWLVTMIGEPFLALVAAVRRSLEIRQSACHDNCVSP